MIAGPCSVESRQQLMQCAHEVKEAVGPLARGPDL
jgi:3-deoxy-D-arabino-heptulosonate 7-phosphate (DAHP) synthase